MRHSADPGSPARTTSGAQRPSAPDQSPAGPGTPSSAQPCSSQRTRSREVRTWTPARTGPSERASVENIQYVPSSSRTTVGSWTCRPPQEEVVTSALGAGEGYRLDDLPL